MGCAHNKKMNGFTLVEISIVMIIIGLLIGGTFGGMKLIENMQVNKTVQDLKAIQSAALTFKDTYGRLPGDMPNTAARLPNCTVVPCATGGDGNRQIGSSAWSAPITDTDELFTFWHHLQAANVLSMNFYNTVDMNFGEGQPDAAFGGGYRMFRHDGSAFLVGATTPFVGSGVSIIPLPSENHSFDSTRVGSCDLLESIDRKIDDGFVYNGVVKSRYCGSAVPNAAYNLPSGNLYYDLKGF